MIRLCIALSMAMAASLPYAASAQTPDDPGNPVHVGDQWSYDRKDEITGATIRTFTATVTEITPKEIVTHLVDRGANGSVLVAFDHAWNRVRGGNFEYKPNDGQGVSFPLAVGREWKASYFSSNVKTGVTVKGSYLSKVVAQETLTTAAGTFDTFKVERQVKEYNTADPSRSTEIQETLWYAPQINHWVRRATIERVEKRLRLSQTDDLIEVARKQ